MKKRILSILLAVLMLLSVLPVTAMAADGTTTDAEAGTQHPTSVSANKDAIHVNKSVVTDTETGKTSLELEAYLTNKVIQTTSTKPLDIVLVLDQSGSMAYDFKGNSTKKDENRRQYAMKQAVKTFIEKVKEQYSDQGNHQMAIVTFADNAKQLIGWTAVDNKGKSALINAIDRLPGNPPEGATNVGAGMQEAQKLMNSKTDANRQKIVIVFTDGVPTTQSDFNTGVADAAIKTAKVMKDAGTIVYTVGIFNGANRAQLHGDKWNYEVWKDVACNGEVGSCWGGSWLSDLFGKNDFAAIDVPAGNRFLNYLSSNFNSAEEIGIKKGKYHPGHTSASAGTGWKIKNNALRNDTNYYLDVKNANELTGAFQTIIQENSTLQVKAGTSTILSDTLSQYFALNVPENVEAKKAITAETWDCTGKDTSGNYTWAKAAPQPKLTINVTDDKTITVTGFDYTENAVTETVKDGKTTYSGSKLVVTIPIKPDTSYSDWQQDEHYYDTNASAALSYGENNGQKLALNESPKAPVTAYSVTYTDGVEDAEIFADQVSTVLPGTATPAFNGTLTREGYEFKGWSPAVTDTVTGNVIYTAQWEKATPAKLDLTGYIVKQIDDTGDAFENDTTFTVNVAPTSGGAGINGTATLKTGSTNFNFTDKLEISGETTFYVSEEDGRIAGVKYDDTVYLLKVTTGLDTAANAVTIASVSYSDDSGTTWHEIEANTGDKLVITNKYNKPTSYNVVYDWGTSYPSDQTRPTDTNSYASVAEARAAVDRTFNSESTSNANNGTQEGTWSFSGWDDGTPNGTTITFTGAWTFTPKQQPGEDTYDVSLTISKTVDNVHGTAPAEDYKFVVYYEENAEKVYISDKNSPLTMHFNSGDTSLTRSFKLKITEEQWNNWPKTDITIYGEETKERLVYVREIEGDTEHMTYAKEPVLGAIVDHGASMSSPNSTYAVSIKHDFFIGSFQDWKDGIFSFTNVYNKVTGRDVTPAKVSPQLNRDDHVAYIMGYPDGNVRPEGEITRAEACTIFFRLLTKESRDYYFSRTNDYTDVSRTDWFNNAISTLSNAGIVTGYADGTFRPDQPITRGEMAKIIANFARLGGATKSFTDLSGHWAKSYVELAAGNGWIAGYPDGTFGPDKKITRAETVTMINRVLERVPAKESRLLSRSVMLTFPDNKPGEWYYIAVQEASNSHTYQRSAYETAGDEMWLRLIENVDWTKLEK